MQNIQCQLNYLSKSHGSAFLTQGETVVLVSVNGPLFMRTTVQNISKAYIEVLFNYKRRSTSLEDRYNEELIRKTCENAMLTSLHPRTKFVITVQEIEDCGRLMSCALNATCLALMNAGVSMKCTFAAVSCAVDASGAVVLDPTEEQLVGSTAQFHFVFDSREKGLITFWTEGSYTPEAYSEALERSTAACEEIFCFYRQIVARYMLPS